MVSVLTLSMVDCGFESRLVKSKTNIGICCFFSNPVALRNKSKDWMTENQIRIMCVSGVTSLPADFSFSELSKSNSAC